MDNLLPVIITAICSIAASSGFWAFLQSRMSKNDVRAKMLLGLAHDRICSLCGEYIERPGGGYITQDEYENLMDYLYEPYEAMGGNGSAKRLVEEVRKLPIRKSVPKVV